MGILLSQLKIFIVCIVIVSLIVFTFSWWKKKLIENKHPFIINIAVAILTIIATLVIDRQVNKSVLDVSVTSKEVILESKEQIDNLLIYYDNLELDKLSQTKILIKNSGNKAIYENQFDMPFIIQFDEPILDISIIAGKPEKLKVTYIMDDDKKKVYFNMPSFNSNDFFIVKILSSNPPVLSVEYRIFDTTVNWDENQYKKQGHIIFNGVFLILFITIFGFYLFHIIQCRKLQFASIKMMQNNPNADIPCPKVRELDLDTTKEYPILDKLYIIFSISIIAMLVYVIIFL